MARTGILTFGSLIGKPSDEIAALEVVDARRRGVQTPFRIEFARSSTKDCGPPTLVPYPDGDAVQAEVIVVEGTTYPTRHPSMST
jgi:hypothetical protein